jgi:hypothetical protein
MYMWQMMGYVYMMYFFMKIIKNIHNNCIVIALFHVINVVIII